MNKELNFILRSQFDERVFTCKPEICKQCQGIDCCQHAPCVYSPYDFHVFSYPYTKEERVKYLIHHLKKGDTSIDHKTFLKKIGAYDFSDLRESISESLILGIKKMKVGINRESLMNLDGILYLRARAIGKGVIDIIHLNWIEDTGCSLWNPDTGCKYTYEKRPKGGRMLVPHQLHNCLPMYSEYNAVQDWSKYQDVLYEVFMYFYTVKNN